MNYKNFINNEWCASESGKTIDVENPYTEEVIAQVPASDEADINVAVAAAKTAFQSWRKLTAGERRDYLRTFMKSNLKTGNSDWQME